MVVFSAGVALSRCAFSTARSELLGRRSRKSPGIHRRVARSDFESWIADDLARIGASVDDVLRKTSLAPEAIDRVFLTGGSSFVPAVRQLFLDRFGPEKIDTGDQLISIAKGLALISASPDAERWAVS